MKPTTVEAYIAAAPKEARKRLREIRACIRKSAPGAKESLKWGMPSFSYHRVLVTYAAHKQHIGFYPTSSGVRNFTKELSKYVTSRGAIQFPYSKPLPTTLIRKITAFRVKESLEKDVKWRSSRAR